MTTQYKSPYIPFKYYKNIEEVLDTFEMDFKTIFIQVIEEIYYKIYNSTTSNKTKKQYIGILRNRLGISEVLKIILWKGNSDFYRENIEEFSNILRERGELDKLKEELKRVCKMP